MLLTLMYILQIIVLYFYFSKILNAGLFLAVEYFCIVASFILL